MNLSRLIYLLLFTVALRAAAQQSAPLAHLAADLCTCISAMDQTGDARAFDLGVRHCLINGMHEHAEEVIPLLSRYPAQDRGYYLLGLLLGHALDNKCPKYQMMKEMRLIKLMPPSEGTPNT